MSAANRAREESAARASHLPVDPSRADGRVAANGCQTSVGAFARMLDMNEQSTLLARIGDWFKKSNRSDGNGLSHGNLDGGNLPLSEQANNTPVVVARSSFLRPWAKRDAAIQQLTDGFHTLTDLMS